MRFPNQTVLMMAMVLAVLAPLAPGVVLADTNEGLTLDWSAPTGCPTKSSIVDSYQRAVENQSPLYVTIEVTETAQVYSTRIQIGGGDDYRVIEAESCEAAAQAAVVYLVLATSASNETSTSEQAEDQEPSTQKPAALPDDVKTALPMAALASAIPAAAIKAARQPATRPTDEWDKYLAVGLGFDYGSLPTTAAFASLHVGVGVGSWSGESRARLWKPSRSESASGDYGADFNLWSISALGCKKVAGSVDLCMGGEMGKMSSKAYGVSLPRAPSMTWLAGVFSVRVPIVKTSAGAFVLAAETAVPYYRDRFRFENEPSLHQASRASAQIGLSYSHVFSAPDLR